MSIDHLQSKIRKTKTPVILEFSISPSQLPADFLPEQTAAARYDRFCRSLLETMKGRLPAVRFGFASFALLGAEGLEKLAGLIPFAGKLGYYVLLDAPELLTAQAAQQTADAFFGEHALFPCDGAVIGAYPGSDVWKPFLPYCVSDKKDIFVAVRTCTRSAPELQDLLSGSRLVHMVAADLVNRYGAETAGRSGYSRVGVLASASGQESLRGLRSRYPGMFILADGCGQPGGSAKSCAAAFDRLGHGAAVCAGSAITCAWIQDKSLGEDWLQQSVAALDRLKKKLSGYINVL